jgi:hypothetical protein
MIAPDGSGGKRLAATKNLPDRQRRKTLKIRRDWARATITTAGITASLGES